MDVKAVKFVELCPVCGMVKDVELAHPEGGFENYCSHCWGPLAVDTRQLPIPFCVLFPGILKYMRSALK